MALVATAEGFVTHKHDDKVDFSLLIILKFSSVGTVYLSKLSM